METCGALDSVIEGASGNFDACNRDEDCLQVSCMSSTSSAAFTIFPCEDPISVRVVLGLPTGPYNKTLTKSESIAGALSSVTIDLEQREGGINFGVRIHS